MKKNFNSAFVYPLLLALYPILFLYAHNLSEVTFIDVFPYLILSFAFFLIVFFFFKFFVVNIEKTGFITAIFFIWFFSYGFILESIKNVIFVRQFAILPIWLCVFIMVFYWVVKRSKEVLLAKFGKILTVIVAVLIIVNLAQILPYEFF